MTLSEWRKKEKISHYKFGQMLGFKSLNPATNSQRYCLESKEKRFPRPDVVKKILKVTNNEVTIDDLYKAWWDEEKRK